MDMLRQEHFLSQRENQLQQDREIARQIRELHSLQLELPVDQASAYDVAQEPDGFWGRLASVGPMNPLRGADAGWLNRLRRRSADQDFRPAGVPYSRALGLTSTNTTATQKNAPGGRAGWLLPQRGHGLLSKLGIEAAPMQGRNFIARSSTASWAWINNDFVGAIDPTSGDEYDDSVTNNRVLYNDALHNSIITTAASTGLVPKSASATIKYSQHYLNLLGADNFDEYIRSLIDEVVETAWINAIFSSADNTGLAPLGILASGLGTSAMAGANPTIAEIEAALEVLPTTVDVTKIAAVTTPIQYKRLHLKQPLGTASEPIAKDGKLLGMIPLYTSGALSLATANQILFGDFSKLVLGHWATDLIIDPRVPVDGLRRLTVLSDVNCSYLPDHFVALG